MKTFLLLFVLISSVSSARADNLIAIINPDNHSALSVADVRNIFLGKVRKFPGGGSAVPVEIIGDEAPLNENFDRTVLNKTPSQLRAYWSQMVFTGRATPPKQVGSTDDLIKLIEANPNMIGFISATPTSAKVKVVPLN